jgi:hypothetical protein
VVVVEEGGGAGEALGAEKLLCIEHAVMSAVLGMAFVGDVT